MPLAPGAETVSTDGKLHGRSRLSDDPVLHREVRDFTLWPNLFLSLQPDYLLTYAVWPVAPGLTRVEHACLFHPQSFALGGLDAADVFDFWDQTNAEDGSVCERQQLGLTSPGYRGGRYAWLEDGVQRFDAFAAARYLRWL